MEEYRPQRAKSPTGSNATELEGAMVNTSLRWLLPLALVTAGCSGPTYFEGSPWGGTTIDQLGFPTPDDALVRTGCLLGTGGGRTTGAVVYRSRDADPDALAGFYQEHGEGPTQRDLDRGDRPPQVGPATVVRVDDHRDVAVVPIEGGVEVIAFIDDAPDELGCH
jgi:hypothetical protein